MTKVKFAEESVNSEKQITTKLCTKVGGVAQKAARDGFKRLGLNCARRKCSRVTSQPGAFVPSDPPSTPRAPRAALGGQIRETCVGAEDEIASRQVQHTVHKHHAPECRFRLGRQVRRKCSHDVLPQAQDSSSLVSRSHHGQLSTQHRIKSGTLAGTVSTSGVELFLDAENKARTTPVPSCTPREKEIMETSRCPVSNRGTHHTEFARKARDHASPLRFWAH